MEFKDIFSKNIMNTELHYITQQSTYTSNIHMNVNDFKIMFSSYEYYKMSDCQILLQFIIVYQILI
jgi:hypothetical protein